MSAASKARDKAFLAWLDRFAKRSAPPSPDDLSSAYIAGWRDSRRILNKEKNNAKG